MNNEQILERLHSRWLEPDEQELSMWCDICEHEIYKGDEILLCENGDTIHYHCKEEWIEENVSFVRSYAT